MKRRNFLLLLIVVSLSITACSFNKADDIETRTDFLMDTVVRIDLYNNKDELAMKRSFARLFEIENRMSKTITTSDIYRLNAEAGKDQLELNPDTYFVLEEAKKYAEFTDSIFDPTIGPLVELWDVKENDKSRDWIPSQREIEEASKKLDYNRINLLGSNKVSLDEGSLVDLGAVVKGYAADEVKAILLDQGVESAVIDLGGNVYAMGSKPDGSNWNIGIQDPLGVKGSYIGILSVSDKSVVTSGDYQRYFVIDDKVYHHIIDPRTGYPADNDLAGVTIISDKSMDGDIYSTVSYILGLEEGMKFIEKMDGIEAIFVTKDREIYLSQGIKKNFRLRDGEKKYKIAN